MWQLLSGAICSCCRVKRSYVHVTLVRFVFKRWIAVCVQVVIHLLLFFNIIYI